MFAVYLVYAPEIQDPEKVCHAVQNAFRRMDYVSGNIQMYITDKDTLKEVESYLAENSKLYYEFKQILMESEHKTIPIYQGNVDISGI